MKNKNFYFKKKVLVAGGTGLVGQPLVNKLINLGAKVHVASRDDKKLCPKRVNKFFKTDLTQLKNCIRVTKGMDIVFNLLVDLIIFTLSITVFLDDEKRKIFFRSIFI